jgi:hypothetical protein
MAGPARPGRTGPPSRLISYSNSGTVDAAKQGGRRHPARYLPMNFPIILTIVSAIVLLDGSLDEIDPS